MHLRISQKLEIQTKLGSESEAYSIHGLLNFTLTQQSVLEVRVWWARPQRFNEWKRFSRLFYLTQHSRLAISQFTFLLRSIDMTTKIINVIRSVHFLRIAGACLSLCALWMRNCENCKCCTVFLNASFAIPLLVPAASVMRVHSRTIVNYLESIFSAHFVRWIRIQVKLWMPCIVAF